MNKRSLMILSVAALTVSFVFFGCKGKVEKPADMESEMTEGMVMSQESMGQDMLISEPAQNLATETIPPTASPEIAAKQVMVSREKQDRNRDIQRALKRTGFYSGSIDGKIGPKTKEAIKAFQKSKGLKVDGVVGPKTWAELEKYLVQQ